ncbi:MAG: hypothetical protein UX85_C0003G0154 [Candidatus Beckwithbacteria bacterium GW2011_GWB1_47_15]|uniref:Uncharacterized protein n=1 Tax=Candidatus Beckwithbacteria bacterium GW2011_GWB1_47_15 TaxID=1618371 RepID=A0A0G1UUV4_9BACT|nr:MAG: hypothetical protein UX50_C0005G0050 [Candidatus Beckwithbacteria bacterium GW2011_GWA1_46_30]KKU61495.1 MAG: hypothetical protein UX85_C0003G0154 [Candidatus Beckwithbacteria bacterium GW2011_GWB1_47_15]KKU71699.1 MAG: hypothetical protein UX97_C0004G0022 [Candidatus Beckwithbacteria bacterium GW2011_GWA2_47_25]KKW03797.1 MAG: hypothetical protein UY37_C0004G0090 [Candidatus Beckwithbacteria bacterium GW2011_GWC2_49_11]
MRWDKVIVHKARKLRTGGRTYSEINAQLGVNVPKSTYNFWFKDLILPESYYKRIEKLNKKNFSKAIRAAQKINREKLMARIDRLRGKNKHLVGRIDKQTGKLLLAMLYLCEGNKYPSHQALRFGSSHPAMLRLFIALLRSCFRLDENKIRGELQCRADQDTRKLQKFWSKVTGISLSRFYPARIDKRTINKPTKKRDYKGVFVVNYFDVEVQLELQLLGEYLGEEGPVAQLVERLHGMQEVSGVRAPSGPQFTST